MASDRIDSAIELEADRMWNLLLSEQEIASEAKVIMEERRMRYEDDPQNSLFEDVVAAAFKVHPYQRPVIGWMSDIRSIGKSDLTAHYRTYYAPRNSVIIVAGDINGKEIVEKIKNSFEGIPSGQAVQPLFSIEPAQMGEKRLFLKREAELPFIIAAYHVPSFPHEDSYALYVLNLILSGGKSSRLYQSLVYEKKVALSASADYSGLYGDPFLFFIFASVVPGTSVGDAEKAINEEIEALSTSPPSELEVQKTKNQIEASFIMGQDSIHVRARQYGMFEMLGDWRLINRYLEGIRQVTQADVVRVAQKYLREENRTIGILIPTKEVQGEEARG